MRTSHLLKASLTLITGFLLSTAPSRAALYHISIDTDALLGANAVNGPFSLDFQLNGGNPLSSNNNTAIISNLTFGGGGSPFGAPNLFGGASGDLGSSITLTDSDAFNEFFQSFSAGSIIGFDLSLTQNVDAGPTPDAFAISILDNTDSNIPTTGFGNTLLFANIDTTGPLTLTLSSGTGDYTGITITEGPAASVPETGSTIVLFALGLLGLAAFWNKTSSPQQA